MLGIIDRYKLVLVRSVTSPCNDSKLLLILELYDIRVQLREFHYHFIGLSMDSYVVLGFC